MAQLNPTTGDNMKPFVVRDLLNGTLISLSLLLQKLPSFGAVFVAFREMHLNEGQVLGLPVPVFEQLSHILSAGFIVAFKDFEKVLRSEAQIIDGCIEFLAADGTLLLRIECIDATQWEVTTEKLEIEAQLERSGFIREPPVAVLRNRVEG